MEDISQPNMILVTANEVENDVLVKCEISMSKRLKYALIESCKVICQVLCSILLFVLLLLCIIGIIAGICKLIITILDLHYEVYIKGILLSMVASFILCILMTSAIVSINTTTTTTEIICELICVYIVTVWCCNILMLIGYTGVYAACLLENVDACNEVYSNYWWIFIINFIIIFIIITVKKYTEYRP